MHEFYFSDRKGAMVQVQAQQGPRPTDSCLGKIFTKVLEASQRAGTKLDFIKNNEIGLGVDLATDKKIQLEEDPLRIECAFKNLGQTIILLKIEIMRLRKVAFPKFLQEISFTALTNPSKNQGHTVFFCLPFHQTGHYLAFHGLPHLPILSIMTDLPFFTCRKRQICRFLQAWTVNQ
jgi:hypothetical protein